LLVGRPRLGRGDDFLVVWTGCPQLGAFSCLRTTRLWLRLLFNLFVCNNVLYLLASLLSLHLDEHAVHLFHFGDPLLVLCQVLRLFRDGVLLPTRWLLHKRCRVFSCFLDALNRGGVNVIAQRWRVELLEAVAHFLLLCELKEIFEASPLLILLVDGQLLLRALTFQNWRLRSIRVLDLLVMIVFRTANCALRNRSILGKLAEGILSDKAGLSDGPLSQTWVTGLRLRVVRLVRRSSSLWARWRMLSRSKFLDATRHLLLLRRMRRGKVCLLAGARA